MASARELHQDQPPRVVVVDLDRTLIREDTLHEQAVQLLFKKPYLLGGLLRVLGSGKVAIKRYFAEHVTLDPANLNACSEVLDFLAREKAQGSRTVLCTAADRRVAEAIAEHLDIFDEIIATDGKTNMKGRAKAELLSKEFPQGFVYAGDHAADLAVWARASEVVLVGTNKRTTAQARLLGKPITAELRVRPRAAGYWFSWLKALRVHHWSKNVLMFVPLLLAHEWFNWHLLLQTAMGFALLLLTTSGTYIINDLSDLDADRRHATKRNRPLASGALPITHGLAFTAVTLPAALLLGFMLNVGFGFAMMSYIVVTLAYSFSFKRVPLLDTFLIGGLFTLRLIMGASLLDERLPVWLVTFSMFFFFSLAMAKRHAEIVRARTRGGASLASRGYEQDDWPLTLTLGVSSGLGSLVILMLYMVDAAFRSVGYSRPEFLWAMAMLLGIWIGRIWLLTHRGLMNDDPVSFALRDRSSQAIAVLVALCFLFAL